MTHSTSITIKVAIATSIPLTGEGDECIVDSTGEVIARFYNGNFVTQHVKTTEGQQCVDTQIAA